MNKVSIGTVQMSCTSNTDQNLQKAIDSIVALAHKGAQIVCLQELFSSLYFCDEENPKNFELAEAIPGPTTKKLEEVAKEHHVVIIASLFEKRAPGLYHNTTAVIDADGKYLGKYRKMHIPDDPGYYEKYYFTPGDDGFKIFSTKYGNVGVLICWDQWFPEAARLTAMKGADFLFYPTAIGWDTDADDEIKNEEYDAWQTIQRSHAIANGLHVISVNRVGNEEGLNFWGGSFIANPLGRIIYKASHVEEENQVTEIDLDDTEKYRHIWPFFRDRRVDAYANLKKRFDAE